MSFTSLYFIALSLSCIFLYYIFPLKYRHLVLLCASLVFYSFAGKLACICLLITMLSSFFTGLCINEKNKTLLISLLCLLNFGMLVLFKYANLGLIAPLGLSFYIFQSIGYAIDCGRKKQIPEKNFIRYALFLSFFPQMVQGPISRFSQISPQLLKGNEFDARNLKFGLQLIFWGYLKKILIADRAAVPTAQIFSNYMDYDGSLAVFGVLLYSIQIYCDFSGGIDIARGIAKCFGIDMAENFKRPIFAQSLAEYWRRWHISLGSWMKDYLFYPLVLSKPFIKIGVFTRRKIKGRLGKLFPTLLATLCVYLAIGFWHGAGLKYLVFGLWNSFWIALSQLTENFFSKLYQKFKINKKNPLLSGFRILRTCTLVFIGRYFSRAGRVMAALSMLKRSFLQFNFSALQENWLKLGISFKDYLIIFIGILILLKVELYEEKEKSFLEYLEEQKAFKQWLWIAIPLIVLYFFGIDGNTYISPEFIYKQF